MRHLLALALVLITATACSDSTSYVQRESPANISKDYRQNGAAVVGIGEPISKRQMRANAVLASEGMMSLADLMERMANTYNVAIRWGEGVNREFQREVLISDLSFNEARSYIEDVYKVQIVREGERRLLVLPSADLERITEFAPGNNVALVDAVRGLAQQCGVNLVINDNRDKMATTRVSARLRNITCPDAFDALLAPQGLSLRDMGDYYSIGGLPQRSWNINLFEPLRSETQRVNYSASVAESLDAGGGGGGGSSAENRNASGASAESVIREERDLWTEMESDLQALLDNNCRALQQVAAGQTPVQTPNFGGSQQTRSGGGTTISNDCGYVRVNRSVGMVQMQAPQTVLSEAGRIIGHIEDIASRRLLVEARVMAVSRTRGYEQGADFSAAVTDDDSILNFGFDPQTNPLRQGVSISGVLASLGGDVNGGFTTFQNDNIDGVVRLIESFSTTYQLMKPTLEVMDRQRAMLIDGRNERYFVRESEVVATADGNIVNTTAEERVQFVGVQFSVSAQIAEGDEPHTVSLQIPITDIVRFEELTQTLNDNDVTDSIPIANTRLIDQKIRIRDGEVKVVGGLTRTMAIDRESGVPLIRGAPVLGKAFNEESIEFEDVEFVVLMQVRRLR